MGIKDEFVHDVVPTPAWAVSLVACLEEIAIMQRVIMAKLEERETPPAKGE